MLRELVPTDLHRSMGAEEWKRNITKLVQADSARSPEDAKVAFLKIIYKWPTFGSAFFEVKVSEREDSSKCRRACCVNVFICDEAECIYIQCLQL